MKRHTKPISKCYKCLLNLGKKCWKYDIPKEQWSGGKKCLGYNNPEFYEEYKKSLELPNVKTRKEIRREIFRSNRTKSVFFKLRRRRGRFK